MLSVGVGLTSVIDNPVTPAALFAGEQGVWYDPSDLTTLFQDSAGTTPVTAAGQPVGLMLDKSKSLALGAELIVNGDLSAGVTGWSQVLGTVSVVGGRLRVARSGGANGRAVSAAMTCVVGRSYRVSFDAFIGTVSTADWYVGISATSSSGNIYNASDTTNGAKSFVFTATQTTHWLAFQCSVVAADGNYTEFDNISVRELAGNHATQATSAQRPTYGIHPYSGVRNLQTQTENFAASTWTKTNSTVSVPAVAPPARGGIYGRITSTGPFAVLKSQFVFAPLTQYTVSGVVKRVSGSQMTIIVEGVGNPSALLDFGTGVFVRNFCTGTVTAIDADTYFLTITFTTPASTTGFAINWWVGVYSGVSTAGQAFDLSAPQIELGSTATAYQKVVTQYEVTQTGVPSVHYIGFDGVDDGMVTSAINFSATNKMTVFAGVRKLSDATQGVVAELTQFVGSFAGGFTLFAPATGTVANYGWRCRGNGTVPIVNSPTTFAAPDTAVFTGIGDISGDIATLRIDGVQVATDTTTDQGTGNFANDIFYIGRRGGSSLPFNGNIYSLIVRGAESTTGQITSTESWVNGKTGAY